MKVTKRWIMLTVFGVAMTVLMVYGSWQNGQMRTLESVEVKGYKGEKLSSIGDFRKNSIRGPQTIDNESYRLAVTGLMTNAKMLTYKDVITKGLGLT